MPAPIAAVLGTGFVAVSFFFVLSGFIMTWVHAERPPANELRRYATARFARIYPLYAFGLLSMVPAWWHHHHEPSFVPASVAVIFGLQAWVPQWALGWNPPAWSLSVEVTFYALLPVLLPWLKSLSLRRVWLVTVFAWLLGLAAAGLYLWLDPDGLRHVSASDEAPWLHALKFNPLVRLPEFLVGMAVARTLQARAQLPKLGTAALGASALFVAALLSANALPYPLLHNGLLTPLCAVLVAWAATVPQGHVLSHRWLLALGDASYALYILQLPAMSFIHGVSRRLWPALVENHLAFGALATVACVAISLLAWAFIERPARRWLMGWSRPLATAAERSAG